MSPVVSKPLGKPQRHVVLGAREFVGRHGLQDAVSSLKNSFSASDGLVGLHAGERRERARLDAHVEDRARAVGVAVLLAQVQVQPRRERSAEDRVHHLDAGSSRASSAARRPSRCGSATAPRPACRRGRSRVAAAAAASAASRARCRARPPSTRRSSSRAAAPPCPAVTSPTTMQRGVVGAERRRVERAQIVGRERLDRLRGARSSPCRSGALVPYSTRANASAAIVAGSSRAWRRVVSRCWRRRSSSSFGNVGRSATSAMIGSASASRATGTCRRTADSRWRCRRSDRRRGSRRRRRSRAPSASRRPPSSIAAVRLATPNLPAGSSALPLSTTRFTCATGTSCSSTIHTGRPFESCRFWIVGSFSAGGGPGCRRLDAIGRLRGRARPRRAASAMRSARDQTSTHGVGLSIVIGVTRLSRFRLPARRSARRADRAAGTPRPRRGRRTADSAR